MSRNGRPTSKDVAAAAGVSVATVSYVMNGRTDRRIPQTTRDRVLAAAKQIGYAPNRAARSLRRRKTEQVCLVLGSFGVPAYELLARSLHDAADAVGYSVITIVVDSPQAAKKAVAHLHERIADGVMIAPDVPYLNDGALVGLARAGLPMVVMRNSATPDGFDVFRAPESPAVGDAMDHMLESGRRRIVFIGHHMEVNNYRRSREVRSERLDGYIDALRRHDVEIDDGRIVTGADHRVDSYEVVTELLSGPKPPDAIFSASARGAVSAIWAARDLGVRVPDDVAVVGAGNLPEVRITRPSLSTVGPPLGQDFAEAARLLFDRVLAGTTISGREVSVPWTFIRREST